MAKEVSSQVYENLLELIDGNNTLRDLAVIMDKNVLSLTVSLIPYLRNGFFRLGETQDISKSSAVVTTSQAAKQTPDSQTKQSDITIVCIDDSRKAKLGKGSKMFMERSWSRTLAIRPKALL